MKRHPISLTLIACLVLLSGVALSRLNSPHLAEHFRWRGKLISRGWTPMSPQAFNPGMWWAISLIA